MRGAAGDREHVRKLSSQIWFGSRKSLRRPDHMLSLTLSLIREADLETAVLSSLSRFSMSSQSGAAGDMQECLRVSGKPHTESPRPRNALYGAFLKQGVPGLQ